MKSVRPWPNVAEEDQWVIALLEERFTKTPLSPEQMRARAKELRGEAEGAPAGGDKDARLALADRYEEAAAKRLARR
jgi:hypothetical protein